MPRARHLNLDVPRLTLGQVVGTSARGRAAGRQAAPAGGADPPIGPVLFSDRRSDRHRLRENVCSPPR